MPLGLMIIITAGFIFADVGILQKGFMALKGNVGIFKLNVFCTNGFDLAAYQDQTGFIRFDNMIIKSSLLVFLNKKNRFFQESSRLSFYFQEMIQ